MVILRLRLYSVGYHEKNHLQGHATVIVASASCASQVPHMKILTYYSPSNWFSFLQTMSAPPPPPQTQKRHCESLEASTSWEGQQLG